MNDKIEEKAVILPPFKHMIMTIGELPSSYVETMTYYEMLVWFTNYFGKTVIPAINENGEAVIELQDLFVKLQTYVNDYFDNLDVQEEINNKLDDMAESGQLTDIIAQYLGLAGMIAFDTVADMKLAENLVNGSKCHTLGFSSYNDGGGAVYKIRQITNDDVVDEKIIISLYDDLLVAELTDSYIIPEKLGALGNGTTDDATSLQKAINYAHSKDLEVNLLNKTYLINTPLTLYANTKIIGNNSALKYNGTTSNYIMTGTDVIDLSNIECDLNSKSYSLIENKHFTTIKMNNVSVKNGLTTTSANDFSVNAGIYLDGKDVTLYNVSSNNNAGHGFIINPSVADSVYLLDKITCNYNGDGTTNISHGLVHITRSYGTNYKQLSILNSVSCNNKQSGLAIHQAQNVSVVNCVCNSNGEHGLVLQDGKNGSVSNSQFNGNSACGIRIQGDFSEDDSLTGYLNSTVSNCIINGTYGIGLSNNVNKCTITNNVINVTRYSVYVSRGQTNEHDSKNIIIKDNYLYSTDATVKSDVVTYGPVENLLIENYCNGELNSTTRYFGNGVTQNLAPKYYGDISNITVDPTNLVSSNWSIFGTNNDGVVTSNSGGYYVGQFMNVTKNTDYISIRFKVDSANSNEPELGYTIELYDASSSLATVISRKFMGGYTELNQTLKISDVTDVTNYSRIRIRIIGTAGKYIKPIYCYINQSSMLPLINS